MGKTWLPKISFDQMIMEFKGKLQLFEGDRSPPSMPNLGAQQLNYPRWNDDFTEADNDH
jgi:hypothetical protein